MIKQIVVKILNILTKKILEKYNPVIIGITGSVGKSSTKKSIYEILKTKYKVACDRGCYGSDINIPLAVIGIESGGHSIVGWLRVFIKAVKIIIIKKDYPEIIILEISVNRPGDMKQVLKVMKPDIGIMTAIGKFPSHVKYFKNAKHIVREKSLLIKSLGKKDLAILNFDDETIKELSKNIKPEIMSYGFDSNEDVIASEILLSDKKFRTEDGLMGMSFKISYGGTTVPFRLPYALGKGQIYSTLSAVTVGIHFGFNLVEMSEIVSNYHPLAGRMNLIGGINESLIIDDSFNASPSSMTVALESVKKLSAKRKIAVLGDMLELGEYCESAHREVGEIVSQSVDILFAYGSRNKILCKQAQKSGMANDNIFYFDDIDNLIQSLKSILQKEDIVLIKGSRVMHMERIVREVMARPELADKLLVK
ncbi:MAG: UDP-N-acetylmuramoyl-tripeptide--D-alanyl-D-alanine ligase [Candidatus Pacebacteria bacterium]|nr:UDP-N-acetylmuramoyl-tripeptide--D-alanyl-D-alanine ligase [Candidatus Paceibacterota bacterium]